MFAMKLICYANGEPTPHDGKFLLDFNFEAFGGIGAMEMTHDIFAAKRFLSVHEALAYRNRVPLVKPTRDDGMPNRPLSATTWEVVPVPEDPVA